AVVSGGARQLRLPFTRPGWRTHAARTRRTGTPQEPADTSVDHTGENWRNRDSCGVGRTAARKATSEAEPYRPTNNLRQAPRPQTGPRPAWPRSAVALPPLSSPCHAREPPLSARPLRPG